MARKKAAPKKRRTYLLPNGKATESVKEYFKFWHSLGNLVCEALGPEWRLAGFDPNFLVTTGHRSHTIPLVVAVAIVRARVQVLRSISEELRRKEDLLLEASAGMVDW